MYARQVLPTLLLALTATALPLNSTLEIRGEDTFALHVHNNCPFDKSFAIYEITADFSMNEITAPKNIPSGGHRKIRAPFHGLGMRLSGHAEWGTAGQWQPQALFEFGYSAYGGNEGTAYDLSVMEGSDGDIGIGAWPRNEQCASKICFPWDCPPDQGWRNPDQINIGSPADTVCYHGKTSFKVVFCP
ncbi:hypothetical protein LTR37_017143 [Vermiconidia calcicola]|uniref:Uncharacterized protein n=1 Tax=Vermiconidia calcicola TaxID=1690605 RepID=A0ACC3MLP6_9PEZI|nr:hypothetical protein LTR37_017143 [Vermiconidia calcicola]